MHNARVCKYKAWAGQFTFSSCCHLSLNKHTHPTNPASPSAPSTPPTCQSLIYVRSQAGQRTNGTFMILPLPSVSPSSDTSPPASPNQSRTDRKWGRSSSWKHAHIPSHRYRLTSTRSTSFWFCIHHAEHVLLVLNTASSGASLLREFDCPRKNRALNAPRKCFVF